MSDVQHVLGIDLASRSWRDNGSAILSFTPTPDPSWKAVRYGVIDWPAVELTPAAMADVIERAVTDYGLSAVSLDGPQGWREPNAEPRKGVGRVCEYQACCQGKTGEYGKTYPQTQFNWISFCIQVFAELRARGNASMANDAAVRRLDPLAGGRYWLLECFPTSTWRRSRLQKLPGKASVGTNRALIAAYEASLRERYEFNVGDAWQGTHDDLQAIVAALPAVGLLGGPCVAHPNGKSGRTVMVNGVPCWVEGLIWDSTLPDDLLEREVAIPVAPVRGPNVPTSADSDSPLIVDERDEESDALLGRGVELFSHLADLANRGEPTGVGYAQFPEIVHGVDFRNIIGRRYATSDTGPVLTLASQITEAAGGKKSLTRDGVTISAGMDAFIWNKRTKDRREAAFRDAGYSRAEWEVVFPKKERSFLTPDQET